VGGKKDAIGEIIVSDGSSAPKSGTPIGERSKRRESNLGREVGGCFSFSGKERGP